MSNCQFISDFHQDKLKNRTRKGTLYRVSFPTCEFLMNSTREEGYVIMALKIKGFPFTIFNSHAQEYFDNSSYSTCTNFKINLDDLEKIGDITRSSLLDNHEDTCYLIRIGEKNILVTYITPEYAIKGTQICSPGEFKEILLPKKDDSMPVPDEWSNFLIQDISVNSVEKAVESLIPKEEKSFLINKYWFTPMDANFCPPDKISEERLKILKKGRPHPIQYDISNYIAKVVVGYTSYSGYSRSIVEFYKNDNTNLYKKVLKYIYDLKIYEDANDAYLKEEQHPQKLSWMLVPREHIGRNTEFHTVNGKTYFKGVFRHANKEHNLVRWHLIKNLPINLI